MNKEQFKKNKWNFILSSLVIILIIISSVIYVNMPKRKCVKSTEITRIELTYYDFYKDIDYLGDDYDILCEEGVTILPYTGTLLYISYLDKETTKICLIKSVTKVCEIK